MTLLRPIAQTGSRPAQGALPLAGSDTVWFAHSVDAGGRDVTAPPVLAALRAPVDGLTMTRPRLMGIVNATPDSFSDGGRYTSLDAATAHAHALIAAGADILDIGGESTRPGAVDVAEGEEINRTAPVIARLRAENVTIPISIDTRKAAVAQAAIDAGATIVNDVSAMTYDPEMAATVARAGVWLCLMHAQGAPRTMQLAPRYDDVVADVYGFLAERVAAAHGGGIAPDRLIVDPGIGFGKTTAHNLALLQNLSALHGLGCPILLGASRKRFIGEVGGAGIAAARMPGSVAVALFGAGQGAQILRVHDVAETRQALYLWQALSDPARATSGGAQADERTRGTA
ncbi:dihydropteroate synthase [Roseicitreum antarcticum]|uniref:Dihydropteroate synthase n=1 Tax=Roseicitreum antarcticum TaxID=564137 RepID=A0A1H2VM63_9RHOB|nr:dihydropteroate synthase [Roseicitreum antarcticum]SDW69396.1 Dihydropteroate synthase [Roseicitreum antarcticum]